MKKLQFLALAMLFAMTSTSFEVQAKSCSGLIQSLCSGSCQWRHGKCRQKVAQQSNNNLQSAVINDDVPQGSPTITNNSNTPPNAAAVIFYNSSRKAITLPTTIWFNGQYVMIPTNAAFIDVAYTASNADGDIIQVMNMQPVTPSGSYSLTNPDSSAQPDDSPANWILTPSDN